MKCVEITREEALVSLGSLVVDAAILVMEMEEVFVARMAWGGQIWASELNIENFKEGISGTASITKSAEDRSSIFVVGMRRERILSDCSWVMRCLVTSLARSLSGERQILVDCKTTKERLYGMHTRKREPFIKRGLICIDESDWHTSSLCCHQCYP